jgi:hypothetical protein
MGLGIAKALLAVLVLTLGWLGMAYGISGVCSAPPEPPGSADYRLVLDLQEHGIAMVGPDEAYRQELGRHRRSQVLHGLLVLPGALLVFACGFYLHRATGHNGVIGGALALVLGPLYFGVYMKLVNS